MEIDFTLAQSTGNPRFGDRREAQNKFVEIFNNFLQSDQKYLIVNAPTGSGKTGMMADASYICEQAGMKSVILEPARILQDEIRKDIYRGKVIKGKRNYLCDNEEGRGGYEEGVRTANGAECSRPNSDFGNQCQVRAGFLCKYYNAKEDASNSNLIIGNNMQYYSMQFLPTPNPDGLPGNGNPYWGADILFFDEAHMMFDQLDKAEALIINKERLEAISETAEKVAPYWKNVLPELPQSENIDILYKYSFSLNLWADWADRIPKSVIEVLAIDDNWKDLSWKLARLSNMLYVDKKEYIVEVTGNPKDTNFSIRICPVFTSANPITKNAKKVVLLSATITPNDLLRRGVSLDDIIYEELHSDFPVENCKIRVHENAIGMTYNEQQRKRHPALFGALVNQAIKESDCKGNGKIVIATHAYKYIYGSDRMCLESLLPQEIKKRVIYNKNSDQLPEAVEIHTNADSNSILFAVGIETGMNFNDDLCRTLIILAVPRKPINDLVTRRRMEYEGNYNWYDDCTWHEIAQMAGRGMRHKEDWCDVLILDKNWKKWAVEHKHLFPDWFINRLDF